MGAYNTKIHNHVNTEIPDETIPHRTKSHVNNFVAWKIKLRGKNVHSVLFEEMLSPLVPAMSADMDWRTISPRVAPEMTRFFQVKKMLGQKE